MIALEHRPASLKTRGNCLGQDFLAERLQYRGEPMCHPLDLLDDADVGNTKRDDAMHELRVYRAIAPDGDCRCFSGGRRKQEDRKSVVSGKSVSDRVGFGGRTILKKKKKQ